MLWPIIEPKLNKKQTDQVSDTTMSIKEEMLVNQKKN